MGQFAFKYAGKVLDGKAVYFFLLSPLPIKIVPAKHYFLSNLVQLRKALITLRFSRNSLSQCVDNSKSRAGMPMLTAKSARVPVNLHPVLSGGYGK